ncbi:FHA domain-containing protein [Anaerovibrio sp.]|uniref:FHA domain-containing protein n=1 Tax=Anaerovibrio sp. TaxID=1872532 RepID=UPI003F1841F3
MQITAMAIKVLSVVLQYGLLFFLLFFVYKAVRLMAAAGRPLVEDIYAETEITAAEAVLTVLEAVDESMVGRRFAFGDSISIGRGDDNDIVIRDGYVSHRHALVELMNNLYVIEDLGSVNKTYVNGQEIAGRQYLQSGDIISIGTVTFQFGR